MSRKLILLITIILAFGILGTIPALANNQLASQPNYQPSNYCVSCHSIGDPRLEHPTAWVGGVAHNSVSPCPAANQVQEEIYYTERMLLAIDRAYDTVPANVDLSRNDARLAAAGQSYSRLLDAPVESLEAFSTEAAKVRYRLGKIYTTINQYIEAAKRTRVLWWGVGVTAVMIVSFAWGWSNARKAIGSQTEKTPKSTKYYISRGLLLLLLFVLFALPIFRVPTAPVEETSVEDQERQTSIDEAGRAALTADRELSRAWVLAVIGADWSERSPEAAESLLDEALVSASEAEINQAALWGISQSAWEAGRAETDMQAKADLAATDLDATRGRAWALRLIAESWVEVDVQRAGEIFEMAAEQAKLAVSPYDQLDLRAIAVAWAKIDPEQGTELAQKITDPALKAWALREIAVNSGDASLFEDAAQSASAVEDPIQQARALREVALASGKSSLFAEAAAALESAQGVEAAYALAELAGAAGDIDLAAQVSSEYPATVALAYSRLGEFETAWQAAGQIADPFEQARAQAAIAAEWGNTSVVDQISNALLRDRALRDISIAAGDLTLVEEIDNPYYKVQAFTALGEYKRAWQISEGLDEGYPLAALGAAWAQSDPQAAAQVLEEITLETDKAVVLCAIASATGNADDFENALGMAMAARVSGDALSPVNATLELANAFYDDPELFEQSLQQAYEIAQIINISY
jgi:hypothetical protein